jgi:hypothetical protein
MLQHAINDTSFTYSLRACLGRAESNNLLEPPRFVVAEAACVPDLVSDSNIKCLSSTGLRSKIVKTALSGHAFAVM